MTDSLLPPRAARGSSASTPCPACGHSHSAVLDSRVLGGQHRRRRQCAACGHRFTTCEVLWEASSDLPPDDLTRLKDAWGEITSILNDAPSKE